MNRSITFVNNKVAEPTVAFVNSADERKERIVLAGVISLLSVSFIATFITIGFLVPRGFWEPLSATVENGMSVYKQRTFPKLSVYDVQSEVSVKTKEDSNGKEKGLTELRPEFPPADKAVEEVTTVLSALSKADFHRPNVAGVRPFPVSEPFKDDITVQTVRKKGSLHRPNEAEHKLLPVPRPVYKPHEDDTTERKSVVPKMGDLHRPNVAEHKLPVPLPVYKPFGDVTINRVVPKKGDLHRPNEPLSVPVRIYSYNPFEDDTINRESIVPQEGDLHRPNVAKHESLAVPLPVYTAFKDDFTDHIVQKKGDLNRPNVAELKPIIVYKTVEEGIIVRTVLAKRYLLRQNVLELKPLPIYRDVKVITSSISLV